MCEERGRAHVKRLWIDGHAALKAGKVALADQRLRRALSLAVNPIDRHFALNGLVELYYRLKSRDESAVSRCVFYARMDLAGAAEFRDAWRARYGRRSTLPALVSVRRLVQVYIEQERHDLAARVCRKAIAQGFDFHRELAWLLRRT